VLNVSFAELAGMAVLQRLEVLNQRSRYFADHVE
jgi:hypothetical protein